MLETLAAELGFVETEALRTTRTRLVAAILSGDSAEGPRLWSQFEELAEFRLSRLPDADTSDDRARARIGIKLIRAHIWQSAEELVCYLRELFEAHKQAEHLVLINVAATLTGLLRRYVSYGEYFQAQGLDEAAIEYYLHDEDDTGLTDKQRGILNLRLTECYRSLLTTHPGDTDLKDLMDDSLQSALVYLDGEVEQGKAQRLLDEVSKGRKEPHP